MTSPAAWTHTAWRRGAPMLVGVGLVLVLFARVVGAAVTHLEQRGFAFLHQCVPDGGSFAWLGTHLAVVRTSPDCPAGTLALGGRPDDVAAVIAAIALPVLVMHLLGGFAGIGLAAHLSRILARCSRLAQTLRLLVLESCEELVLPTEAKPTIVIGRSLVMPRRLALALAPVRRGPPAALAA